MIVTILYPTYIILLLDKAIKWPVWHPTISSFIVSNQGFWFPLHSAPLNSWIWDTLVIKHGWLENHLFLWFIFQFSSKPCLITSQTNPDHGRIQVWVVRLKHDRTIPQIQEGSAVKMRKLKNHYFQDIVIILRRRVPRVEKCFVPCRFSASWVNEMVKNVTLSQAPESRFGGADRWSFTSAPPINLLGKAHSAGLPGWKIIMRTLKLVLGKGSDMLVIFWHEYG